jgi:hypothetical protein
VSVAVLIGIPASLRARIERHLARRVELRVIPMKQDGGFRLESPPNHAARILEQYADGAGAYEDVTMIVLRYAHIPEEVSAMARVLAEVGANLIEPEPASTSGPCTWPARTPRLDKEFQDALCVAVCALLDQKFPVQVDEDHDRVVACEMIRALAVHSKMGENNHSHEDDLWRACGRNLGPGERERIVRWLMADGILSRKKNKSKGGTGWVYWIADVEKSSAICPDLAPYFR